MTTMTLRISGKNPRNNSKLHGDHKKIHITVNARFLNEARTLETNCYCVSDEVEKLSKVETVEEQLKILKLMAKNCSMSDCDSENKLLHFCVKLLTDFYLTATPKNPLKNAIPRLLSTFPQAAHDDITAYLSYELTKLMESTLQNSSPLKEMNAVVNTISCCFVNNFTLGIKSVGHAIVDVIAYIKSCLSRYIKELKQNIPIAAKQEVCQFSHATMQTLVSVLQKCQPSIKSRMSARDDPGQEPAPANGIVENGVGEDVAAMLAELRKSAEELLNLDDCPMDMKANCGLVVVLLSMYLEGDEGWQKLLSRGAAPSDGVQLCLCVGVLNALSPRQLLSAVPPSGRPVLWSVFDQLVGVSCRASASSSMALAASRAMLLLSRDVLACVQGGGGAPVLPLERLREALVFVWTHLEHYMDSVRHSAHVTLLNYVRAAAALANPGGDDGKAMNAIMESVMNIPAFKKCRYVGLSTLAREIGCQPILERVPSLVEDFISSLDDTAVSASVSGAFETLMLRHEGECADPDAWVSTWLLPALRRMAAPALDGVLSKAVGRRPAVVLRLLGADPGRLRAVLTCLRAGRRRGALSADDGWKGLLPCSLLEGALWHRDEQIRVCALSLLVESHRSTEALSGSDLQLVRTFLEYNINTQSPATRQQALALVKKLLIRVKDSSAVLARATEQAGKGDPPAAASAEPCPTAQLRTYNTFLLWLVDFCLASLFPGANFGHRGSALQILVYIQELVGFEPSDPVWRHSPPDMWTSSNADTLLECLKDTYENNKSLALSLLVRFPAEALGLNDEDYAGLLLDAGCQMASSNRPPDCVTAAYLLKLLSSFPVPVATLAARVGEAPRGGALFYVVCRLEAQLSGELEVARRSISLAAAKGPMYGTLCCVRYLLKDTDLRRVTPHTST
ncbi:tRNA (32-2'-O)-methyltransferase regulator THADA-like [Bacillus rossius redtenbacheri]|uniref:tRNA (32-2'-O)-methyltransferase regulator THADA-like n=1 Tax=Bacillus rossius redtenbacheri TaxID=93214 RepID=UPI002FDD48F4